MTTATTNRTTSRHSHRATASRQDFRPAPSAYRSAPMPRSTTRVIWTMSSGTTVQYGEVR